MIILPYPISTNRYWRTFRGMTVVSEEAKAYKKQVAQIAQLSGCIKHNGNVSIDKKSTARFGQLPQSGFGCTARRGV